MRWEEIWDAALRIRSAFLVSPIPDSVTQALLDAWDLVGKTKTFVVRSSAPKEDSSKASFAGLHESYVGILGKEKLLDAIRLVWASLWSDAALLYQHELGLDPGNSTMAVLVQELHQEDVSGVAFGCDPAKPKEDKIIIEAVPGLCRDLVDGALDPDRWIMQKTTGNIIETRKSTESANQIAPLLDTSDLLNIYHILQNLEKIFQWIPDMEWTGKKKQFTLLQARPITTASTNSDDEKAWYLSLRPGEKRLEKLARKVTDKLIPKLKKQGHQLAAEDLSIQSDQQLAKNILARKEILDKWNNIYRDDFIPFAHGVRRLAMYYNDAVRPTDPYEFTGLLKGQKMISLKRNQKLVLLADFVRKNSMYKELKRISGNIEKSGKIKENLQMLTSFPEGDWFYKEFMQMLENFMDTTYGDIRLEEHPEFLIKTILELSLSQKKSKSPLPVEEHSFENTLEIRLLEAVGKERHAEALKVIEIGRLSWKLRDDDNLLIGKIESQLIRAIIEGADRLHTSARLKEIRKYGKNAALPIAHALQNPNGPTVIIPHETIEASNHKKSNKKNKKKSSPRQLVGQPAAPDWYLAVHVLSAQRLIWAILFTVKY